MSPRMRTHEYKVVAAPHQGRKAKGVKATADRFALSLGDVLNEMAEDGWDYVRAETLPCDERRGLTGTQTTFQNVLVFRRAVAGAAETVPTDDEVVAAPAREVLAPPAPIETDVEDAVETEEPLRASRGTDTAAPRRLGPATAED